MRRLIIYLLPIASVIAVDSTWNVNANGNWDTAGNWTPAAVPNGAADIARFLGVITATRTITVVAPKTVGQIFIDDNNNYVITGSTLSMNNSGSPATITVTNTGTQTIASALSLIDNLSVSQSSSALFTLSGVISGVGKSLTKTGTNILVLSNTGNSYSGTTAISTGTLRYGANGAIPAASVVIIDGTLQINATMTPVNALDITLNPAGTLISIGGTEVDIKAIAGTGTVNLGTVATMTYNVAPTVNSTFSGIIAGGVLSSSTNPTAGNRLTKRGTTTWTLDNTSNSYISRTFIENGTLIAKTNNALGITGPNSAVYVRATGTSGTLQLEGSITLPKTLFLNGAGFSGGALRNAVGDNIVTSPVNIGWTSGVIEVASAATIQVDTGTSLTFTGIVANSVAGTNVTKSGDGQLNYGGAGNNTLTGTTIVSAGTLNLAKTGGGRAINGPTTINTGGTLFLTNAEQILNTATVTIAGGTFNMNGLAETIGQLIFTNGTLTQTGGLLTLSNAASTALSMGNGTANTTIPGNITFSSTGNVVFTGPNNTATIQGTVNLSASAHTFNIDTSTAPVSMDLQGPIIGTGSITKSTGTGILQYSGSGNNTYSGVTTINAGTILLNKSGGAIALQGNSTINAGGTLQLAAADQIANTSIITLNGGTFNLNSFPDTIGSLVFTTGTLIQNGATLSLNSTTATTLSMASGTTIPGNITFTNTGGVTYVAGASTATIQGNIDLGTFGHTFNIGVGGPPALDIQGAISNTGAITKSTGTGTLQFSGLSANTYTGLTTVTAGQLTLSKPNGTNAIAGNVTINGATGTLFLANPNQIASTSTVTLSNGTFNMNSHATTAGTFVYTGGTFSQGGALLTLAGNTTALTLGGVTINGPIALTGTGSVTFNGAATAAVFSPTSSLDLGTQIHTFAITNGGATPDMDIQCQITGTGGLAKTGNTSQLRFSGMTPNTYSGLTTVTQGTLLLAKTASVNAIGGNAMVSGGTLQLGAADQIPNTSTVTIAGGVFNVVTFNETIDNLVFNSGTYTQTGGVLSLASNTTALTMRNVTLGGTIQLLGTGSVVFDNTTNGTATISGILNLGALHHNFDVAMGTAANDMTVSGVITNGSLTKINAGRLQFSGASPNTYTGLTTVSDGILLLNKTASIVSIPGDALINGTGILQSNTANQLANTSTVTLSGGTWSLLLSTSDTQIGHLIFNSGLFTQAAGAVLGLSSNVTALTMRDATIAGAINLTGTGDIVFDSTNNGTALLSGPVSLNAFSHTFNIADGSSTPDMHISGVISGASGSLVKTGTGLLLLSGANTYSGGTSINGGTLQGDATSLQGPIVDNSHLIFDLATAGTYAGNISGTGTVIKRGDTLTLTGTNAIGGLTTVETGALLVNGTLGGTGQLTVNAGATIGGTGPINKNSNIFGFLRPGNSIGAIHFAGNQVMESSSTLEVELNPTTADLTDIIGTYTIQPGATLNILPDPANYTVPFTYVVVHTTGGVFGTFSHVTSTLPLFTGSVVTTPTEILLHLLFVDFVDIVTKGNASKVARCLDAINPAPDTDLQLILNDIRMLDDISNIQDALNQMQPSQFTALAIAVEDDTLYINNAIFKRLESSLSCCKVGKDRPSIWVAPFGAYTTQHSRQQELGFKTGTPGVFVGLDAPFREFRFGAGFGYVYTDLWWTHNRGNATIQSLDSAVYGRWSRCLGYIESSLQFGYNWYKTTRHIDFEAMSVINRKAQGNHNGLKGAANLKGALNLGKRNTTLSPFAEINYIFTHENSFKEHGAQQLDLDIRSKNTDLLIGEGGFDLTHYFSYCNKFTIAPFLELAAQYEYRMSGGREVAGFNGCTLDVVGFFPSRWLGLGQLGLNVLFPESEVSLFYQGRYGRGFQDQSAYLEVLFKW